MTFKKRSASQGYGQKSTASTRRRRLGRAISRKVQLEKLEDRRLLTATPNYWSEDGTFDVANVATNYVNSANFIQGFTATPPLLGTQPGVFSQSTLR